MKSVEDKVLDFLMESYPQPVLAEEVTKKVHKSRPAIAAVLQCLYEKHLITCEGGGFVVTNPNKYRSIDAAWGG